MLEDLIALFAPHECIGCSAEGKVLCASCENLVSRDAERCYRCKALSVGGLTCQACYRKSRLYSLHAAADYQHLYVKELINRLKFGGARAAAKDAARIMAARGPALPRDAVITHLPTASGRRRQRGYDQAALIARELARLTGLPYRRCLVRLGQQRQVGASRQQRLSQLQGQITVVRPAAIAGQQVIIVDDVVTTGASLEAAAEALRANGARRVQALVFARA
jgi:ComF family protein